MPHLTPATWDDPVVQQLTGLEAATAARGWTTPRLETGNRQPEAVALSTSGSDQPIRAFGHRLSDGTDDSLFARTLA